MLIRYNFLAVAGAGLGLLNTVLTWKLLGASAGADSWLLVLALVAVLAVLVQLGVEQYLVVYTEVLHHETPSVASAFASHSLLWALASGGLFATVCALGAPTLCAWFAGGLSAAAQHEAASLLRLALLQVALAPLLHVTRGTLNAHGHYGKAYGLSLVIPLTLTLALLLALAFPLEPAPAAPASVAPVASAAAAPSAAASASHLRPLAFAVALGAGLQGLLCLLGLAPWCASPRQRLHASFWPMVRNSVSMRLGHSLHNFFVGQILNNALSHQAQGAMAVFQYAKRFADGVASVTVGPQNSIYHARQAAAWTQRDWPAFTRHVRHYLRITSPLLVLATAAVALALPVLLQLVNRHSLLATLDSLQQVFLVLMLWQAVIALETIAAGVVVTARRSLTLWAVNGLFVLSFYAYVQALAPTAPPWQLGAAALLAQLVSALCFAGAAWRLVRQNFKA